MIIHTINLNCGKRAIGVFVIFLFFSTLSLNAQYVRFTKAYNKRYVYLADVAKYYGMGLRIGRKKSVMSNRYANLIFTFDKRAGKVNGVNVTFLNAPFLRKGVPFISERDFLLFIDPILRKGALRRHRLKTVLIDPGHGRHDNGAVGARYKEKNLVLQLGKSLKRALLTKGFKVIMSRESDTFLSLKERAALAAKLKPDIFISLHCNAAKSKSASGIETFCVTPAGEASSSDSSPQNINLLGNKHNKENARLAFEIQKNLIRSTRAKDRGVKFARFFVLKNINCPGVLVETGFLSNNAEEKRLGYKSYQTKIVNGLLNGILEYRRATK